MGLACMHAPRPPQLPSVPWLRGKRKATPSAKTWEWLPTKGGQDMTLSERALNMADCALCFLLFEWEPQLWQLLVIFALALAAVGHWDVM